jgi:hypothetical protein
MREYQQSAQSNSQPADSQQPSDSQQLQLLADLTNTSGIINMTPAGFDIESLATINELDDTPQAISQSLELGGENAKVNTLEQETTIMQSTDPWLQRKMEQANNQSS